jgi:hypothetical protein
MSMILPGLRGTQYVGYFNEDPNWFQTAESVKSETVLSWVNTLSGENGYSWEFLGTFVPHASGYYGFNGQTDDAMILWLGSNAEEGNFSTENFHVSGNASGFTSENRMLLSAGVHYPIRIQWGHPTEPTFAGFGIRYNYYDDEENYYGDFSDWTNVTFHEVPYTINIVQQPTTQSGGRGELLFFSCSAVASNNEPVSYNWILSGSEFWMGENILNIDQFIDFSSDPSGIPNVEAFNRSVQFLQNNFKADTNTLILRNTDATAVQGLPLSSFKFICVPFLSSEPAPFRYQNGSNREANYKNLLETYPHSNSVSAIIDSFPEYEYASPYYLLRVGEVVTLADAEDGISENSVVSDASQFPGLISFISLSGESLVATFTNNPNELESGVVVFGINSAEGFIQGNKTEYLSALTTLSAGIISFIQNENTASYSFNAESFYLTNEDIGPLDGTYLGMYQNSTEGLTLISPSPELFNSRDPITIRIESDYDVQTQNDTSVFSRHAYGNEAGLKRFLRLRHLGYV